MAFYTLSPGKLMATDDPSAVIETYLGSCVGVAMRAALMAQTKPAFISKISIVIEEADESEFWFEFIIDEKLMPKKKVFSLYTEAHELASIFIITRRTAQKKG